MCNGNVYKRFCSIMISLGVILSIGQYSCAHNPALIEAERTAKENPTMETLGRLYDLYKKDVEYHKSRKEYDGAEESEAGLLWTRKQQLEIMAKDSCEKAEQTRVIANNDKTPNNYENEAKYRIQAASLFTVAGDAKSAASAKENAAKCWRDAATLEKYAGNLAQSEAYMKIAEAIAGQANKITDIVDNNKTLKEYENEIRDCYDTASKWTTPCEVACFFNDIAKCKVNDIATIAEILANTDRW